MTRTHTHLTGELQAGLAISIKEGLIASPGYNPAPSAFEPDTCNMTVNFNNFIIELNKHYATELNGFTLNTAHVKTLFTRMNVRPIWPRQQGSSIATGSLRLEQLEHRVDKLMMLFESVLKSGANETVVKQFHKIKSLRGVE